MEVLAKLKLLNNTNTIDSEFSDFEKDTFLVVNFENEFHRKTIINNSKFSATYKFKSHNKWLCLKQLNKEFSKNTLYNETIENEFNIGYELDHSNIVQYYNFGKNSDGPYVIKEYIDGIDLKKYFSRISSEKKFYAELERIFNQLFDALNYIHSKQIYHLDLKPSNILITRKGNNVKLIDFGFSTRDHYTYIPSGTKKYLSPEQIINPKNVDGRSDIYSIGKILEELITLKKTKGSLKHTFSYLKYLKIVRKCLNENQSKRFNSISELKISLHQINTFRLYFLFIIFLIVTLTVVFYKPKKHFNSKPFSTNKFEKKLHQNTVINQPNTILKTRKQEVDSKNQTTYNPSIKTINYNLKVDKSILNKNQSSVVSDYQTDDVSFSNLLTEDKLFCENLIDSLHSVFEMELTNKPTYIDINKLILRYKIQLITFGNKQLTKYNFKFCNNKNRVTELRNYFNLLKKRKLESVKTL